ncbi:coiled-coil domain-containing protein 9B [Eucyclogobius newberryi]|uniref:coiled-coil domain-containing protein 9B n=1 Tax=Eucyclogobius newberryi TaxID=166745 RepID=UPI003B592CBD
MDKSTSDDLLPKRNHDKNLELDKKIEALRRKNAALMKRYQEVEEDKKKAEEEGMALQSRKGKADDLSITISKSANESRVVSTKPHNCGSDQERAGEGSSQSAVRVQRKLLTVTMPAKKGKRVVIEKSPEPSNGMSDDGQLRHVESMRLKPAHVSKKDTAAQDEVTQGEEQNEEQQWLSENLQPGTDLNIPTSKEEQGEYLQWKKEREQIDRERVARHKNAKGQWRRAWDMDKSDHMYSDKSGDWLPPNRGGRSSRRGQNRSSDTQGHARRGKVKEAKNVQVMGSKAKGKDRLTGRARRWESTKDGNVQDCEATLEEFLEELDALTELVDQRKVEDTEAKPPLDYELETYEHVTIATETDNNITEKKVDGSGPRGSERKVRFSDELKRESGESQEPVISEPRCPQSIKGSSPKKDKTQVHKATVDSSIHQEGGESPSAPCTELQQNECTPKAVISPSDSSTQDEIVDQPVEVGKCNMTSTNTEELIDSGLSVLSMESGEAHQAHSTSSDKAREHGKIV